ncbi:MAG: putative DNA binding domain-containing protein [Oscillospiraceae bacterium]|jgi:ATP-dependent DNA helicase RecG|nr:putative DNA binding domain-containing protein [Oscillospiraceae bacterium]
MEIIELLSLLERGEDSSRQFKKNINSREALASEMVAFSNGGGGKIFIGVDDDGSISGLTGDDVRRLNQMISNVASQWIQPAINPSTENIMTDSGLVVVVDISSGINKPYQDKDGIFWVKNGADKRKATSREEIQRLFQASSLVHADELPVAGVTTADLDLEYFGDFFQRRFGRTLDAQTLPLPKILENMNLLKDDSLNVAATLLFSKSPQFRLPIFIVKAGAFDANDLAATGYNDSRDITGKLSDVFRQTVSFIVSNLRHIQGEQGINSVGIPEIPPEAIEELVANALIHRDYFLSAPVQVFVFRNRVEIRSPGHLPNNLTVANIKSGNSNARNPLLASFANHVLPYRGYGSGILRALSCYPDIDFFDDREKNWFVVTLKRSEK